MAAGLGALHIDLIKANKNIQHEDAMKQIECNRFVDNLNLRKAARKKIDDLNEIIKNNCQ